MANPSNRDDHDSPWKEALELYFYQAIKLLAPPLYDLIDPSVPPVFLDKELQSLLIPDPDTAAGQGRLYADKLVQTRQRNRQNMFVLVHIEVQGGRLGRPGLQQFAHRMYQYSYRIDDFIGRLERSNRRLADGGSDSNAADNHATGSLVTDNCVDNSLATDSHVMGDCHTPGKKAGEQEKILSLEAAVATCRPRSGHRPETGHKQRATNITVSASEPNKYGVYSLGILTEADPKSGYPEVPVKILVEGDQAEDDQTEDIQTEDDQAGKYHTQNDQSDASARTNRQDTGCSAELTKEYPGLICLEYKKSLGLTTTRFTFPVVKLQQWADHWDRLQELAPSNPFAVFVMAQLRAVQHRDKQTRLAPLVGLVRDLHHYGYSREHTVQLIRLVEWMLRLPKNLAPAYLHAIKQLQQEHGMSYVTIAERYYTKIGMEKGMKAGRAEGLQAGRAEGLQTGRAEGLQTGRAEGLQAGRAEGQASLLMRLIERRFGPVPDDIAKRVSSANTDQLETWSLNFVDADILEDVFRE